MSSKIGYVIGTQCLKTVKVRVPVSVYLPKYKKSIIRHKNYLAHDETDSCLVGDIVKIEETPRFNENKNHAVAEMIKRADRFVDPKTKFVYTNGHLHIPVGYSEMDEGGKEIIRNRIPKELYVKMGLL